MHSLLGLLEGLRGLGSLRQQLALCSELWDSVEARVMIYSKPSPGVVPDLS